MFHLNLTKQLNVNSSPPINLWRLGVFHCIICMYATRFAITLRISAYSICTLRTQWSVNTGKKSNRNKEIEKQRGRRKKDTKTANLNSYKHRCKVNEERSIAFNVQCTRPPFQTVHSRITEMPC